MDDGELVFVDTITRRVVGHGILNGRSGQERFGHIATLYLAESESWGVTNI